MGNSLGPKKSVWLDFAPIFYSIRRLPLVGVVPVPRANRYIVPENVYYLAHRCQDREFLLKYARARDVYRRRLREAMRKRVCWRDERAMWSMCSPRHFCHGVLTR